MNFVTSAIAYASVLLQFVLLVSLLLRGNFRRYPLLLFYSIVFFAATLTELVIFHTEGIRSVHYKYTYMTDEAVIDLTLFLMVIAMTYQAMGENPLRAKVGRLLAIVVVGTILLPFLLFRGPIFLSRWFNETSQMLNFGAAIMNLALWTALLGNRKRDALLLSVSAGLGVAVTGAAISYGLAHFKWSTYGIARELVNLIKSLSNVASLIIWCWAFWPFAKRARPQAQPPQ
jgi:hypothetical protein